MLMPSLICMARRAEPTSARAGAGGGTSAGGAATCAVVAANRNTGAVVEKDAFEAVECKAGRAVLRAVVAALPADVPPPAPALAEVGSALRAMQIRLGMR